MRGEVEKSSCWTGEPPHRLRALAEVIGCTLGHKLRDDAHGNGPQDPGGARELSAAQTAPGRFSGRVRHG